MSTNGAKPHTGFSDKMALKDTRKRKDRIFLDFDENSHVLDEKKSYRMVKVLS